MVPNRANHHAFLRSIRISNKIRFVLSKFLELFPLSFLPIWSEWLLISCDQTKLRLGTLSSWVLNPLALTPHSLYLNNGFLKWLFPWTSLAVCMLLRSLTLPAPCISVSCIKIKIYLNFYFHTSSRCLKRHHEELSKWTLT